MERRMFLGGLLSLMPLLAVGHDLASGDAPAKGIKVESGRDRFRPSGKDAGGYHIDYKVSSRDTNGQLFILEQTITRKGGPPRHVHFAQDEWFYVIDGEYIAEVGSDHFRLQRGDSLFAPRMVPHAWAHVGASEGKLLIGFTPAGTIESFFDELSSVQNLSRDPGLFEKHGMKVVGPPLEIS